MEFGVLSFEVERFANVSRENCKTGGFPNFFHKKGGSAHRNCGQQNDCGCWADELLKYFSNALLRSGPPEELEVDFRPIARIFQPAYNLQSRSRAIAPGTVVLLAAATTAAVPHSLADHTVTHGATSAANAFVL